VQCLHLSTFSSCDNACIQHFHHDAQLLLFPCLQRVSNILILREISSLDTILCAMHSFNIFNGPQCLSVADGVQAGHTDMKSSYVDSVLQLFPDGMDSTFSIMRAPQFVRWS
jgi:hypothetical protein